MNEQPAILPVQPRSSSKLPLVALILFLVIGVVGFGILSAVLFTQANHDRTTLNSQKVAAATAARAEQQKTDSASAELAAQSPYRSYIAPVAYGSFEIKFPKNWASYVAEDKSGVQVNLLVNPDFVRRTNGVDMLIATKVTLNQKTAAEVAKQYAGNKKITSKNVIVSGLASTEYSGDFGDKRTVRIVVVPVRDKTIIFTNENSTYAREFDEIVAQSKIVP